MLDIIAIAILLFFIFLPPIAFMIARWGSAQEWNH
jgi:hypothetical protein